MESGQLYLIATPIGNLGDISQRACQLLGQVDCIASESPQAARRLLSALGLSGRVTPFREANREAAAEQLLSRIESGEQVALLSEAGMPAISDPGWTLVRACHERGLAVTCLPGASALTTAVALSGLPSRRFVFEGFLPRKGSARREVLRELAQEVRTIVLFEAPHRLEATLRDLVEHLGPERLAFLGRELTKKFETLRLTSLGELLRLEESPRGEYVLVIAPGEHAQGGEVDLEFLRFLQEQGLSTRQIASIGARLSGQPRRVIYSLVTELKETPPA